MSNLVKKISVITGLKMDDVTKDMFAEEFCKFLLVHYGEMTVDEVSAAFSINATEQKQEQGGDKVIFYSGHLTLEHVGQVLTKYKSHRAAVVRKLNASIERPDDPPPSEEQMEVNDIQFVNEYYRKFLNEELKEVSLSYAHMVYDTIKKRRSDLIPHEGIRKKYYWEAKAAIEELLAMPNKDRQAREEARTLLKDYLENSMSYTEEQRVINEGKKRTLMYMFQQFAKDGLKELLP